MSVVWVGVVLVVVVVAAVVGGGVWLWGLIKAFHKQMTSFQIQSYISVPQLSKQQQILSKGI